MSQPMIAWCAIAGMLLCTFLSRAIERHLNERHQNGRKHSHPIEIGREKDIFYIPGDIDENDDADEW